MIGELKTWHCPRCGSDVHYRLWKWKGFVYCGGCVAELKSNPARKPGRTVVCKKAVFTPPWWERLWNWIKKIMRVGK